MTIAEVVQRIIGDSSSLPVLTKRLHDRYPGIQLAAKQATGAIERRTTSKHTTQR